MIRITKEFRFEAAHVLHNYDGLCQFLHGHSYRLFVTVIGNPIEDQDNPKYGMVMDFGDLKKMIKKEIIEKFDHSLILPKIMKEEKIDFSENLYKRTIFMDYQPTSENIISDIANRIKRKLPSDVKLHSLKLYETSSAYTEWFASENPD